MSMDTLNKLMFFAKIRSKNQRTLPKKNHNKLDLHAQGELTFEISENGKVLMKKVSSFWELIAEKTVASGSLTVEAIDWGEALENEVID